MAIENDMVQELADLQKHSVTAETEADAASTNIDAIIDLKKQELAELETVRSEIRYPYEVDIAETKNRIGAMQDCIIEAWDGKRKTTVFDAGTLAFRTTKSVEIVDGGRLLKHIIEKTSTDEAVSKYLKGFLLTPTKAYVDVHGLGEGIAKINSKTTVKLDVV